MACQNRLLNHHREKKKKIEIERLEYKAKYAEKLENLCSLLDKDGS